MPTYDPFAGHASPIDHPMNGYQPQGSEGGGRNLVDPFHPGGLGGTTGSGLGSPISTGAPDGTWQAPHGQQGLDPSQFGAFGSLNHDFGAGDFATDPGYGWRLQQGISQIDRSAAARGGLLNGGTLRALDRYNQNFASNEYQNAYTRYNNNQSNRFNRLAALSGIGQASQNQLTGYSQNLGGQIGNNILGAGNAAAAGAIGQGNAWQSGLNGLGNAWAAYNWGSPSGATTTGYGTNTGSGLGSLGGWGV